VDLLEYQGEQLSERRGIPVPTGRPAASVQEAVSAAEGIAELRVDPLLGLQEFHGRKLALEALADRDLAWPIGALLTRLYGVSVEEDALLAP
jgi:succinyl-CoA synthetase beta subunit